MQEHPDRDLHVLLHSGAVQPGRPGRQPAPLRRYIPGIRPGPPTAQYLDRVLTRLTLPGAIYLALVATLPTLFIRYGGFSQATAGALGGTSVLIAVGVALDTMRQMESQMMMRSYEGFLSSERPGARPGGRGRERRQSASRRSTGSRTSRPATCSARSTADAARPRDQRDHGARRPRPGRDHDPDDPRAAGRRRRARRLHPRRLPAQPRPGRGARRDAARNRPHARRDLLLRPRRRDRGARALGRAHEEGRTDDTPETIAHRLAIYHAQTEPVVEYYRTTGKLVPLHAGRTVEDVFAEVEDALATVVAR